MPVHTPHSILVPVKDMSTSVSFFRETMGLKLKIQDGTRYAAFELGSLTLALVADAERVVDEPALSFRVSDIAAAVAGAREAGAQIVLAVAQGPHEKRAVLREPGGTALVFSEKTG